VVPEQEHAVVVPAKSDQALDDRVRVEAAVHVVTQEDQTISPLERELLEKLIQLPDLSVNVTDRVKH
jgi:hypothetical protein